MSSLAERNETITDLRHQYAGSDWMESQLLVAKPPRKMSFLGYRVADLMGEWMRGIYHLDHAALKRVEWENDHWVSFCLGWRTLATFDFDDLTRLVFLAHRMAIRVEVEGARNKILRLSFSRRIRRGGVWERHPSLSDAVSAFDAEYPNLEGQSQ